LNHARRVRRGDAEDLAEFDKKEIIVRALAPEADERAMKAAMGLSAGAFTWRSGRGREAMGTPRWLYR
jgi:hypothetical protein